MPFYRRKAVRRTFLLLVIVGILLSCYALRNVFNPLLIGLMLAYILNPVANGLERRGIRRSLAVVTIYVLVLAPCLAGVVFLGTLVYIDAGKVPNALFGEEEYVDANQNGRYDTAEPLTLDANHDGRYDSGTDEYLDLNENGKYDPAEAVSRDTNGNGAYDPGLLEKAYIALWEADAFEDRNGNGRYDPAEKLSKDVNGNGQYDRDDGDQFDDLNGNGRLDAAEKLTKDVNNNGQLNAPEDQFEDLNKNGRFDPGDKLRVDRNGNGKYDPGFIKKLLLCLPGEAGGTLVHGFGAQTLYQKLKESMTGKWNAAAGLVKDRLQWLQRTANNMLLLAFSFILVGVYTFFFILGMNSIGEVLFKYLPGPQHDTIADVLMKIHKSVSSFFRGRLIVCAIVGLLTGLGMSVLEVRFAILLGLFTGIGNMVPFLGIIMGLVPAVAFTYIDYHSLARVIAVVVWFSAVQGAEGMILVPLVMRKQVEMHPVTLIVSLLIGAQLFGLFGVLIAIPFACILKILGQEFVLPELRQLARDRE